MKRNIQFIYLLFIMISISFSAIAQHNISQNSSQTTNILKKTEKSFVETDPPTGNIRPIAEFEPMESVIIAYPLGIPPHFVATLSEDILVNVLVSGPSQENNANNLFTNAGVNMSNIKYIYSPTDTYWSRDFSPWFIEYGDEENPAIGIIDFPYNRPRPYDDNVPVIMADSLNLELFGMDVVQTGGNFMCDGIKIGAATDLVSDENNISDAVIDQRMKDYMGIEIYHKNEDPLDDYIKHIDCWGKFLDVDKILIGQVPESDYRYADFEAVAQYYEEATSGWGTPYHVYRVYTPDEYTKTPYTNSLILNNRVFVPQTGSQWDDDALETYRQAMPGYEIIGVMEGAQSWLNTDALHCRTHEVADREMLRIKHMPILGEVDAQDDYTVTADIYSLGGETLYTDSIKVYYKYGKNMSYQYTLMENTEGNTFVASIPASENSDSILYYVHAADMSGRSENHPYIGAADPHDFIFDNASAVANIDVNFDMIEIHSDFTSITTNEFVISNNGGANLTYALSFEYENEDENWISSSTYDGLIAPNDNENIILTIDCQNLETGNYSATMKISSNDPTQQSISIPIYLKYSIGIDSPDDIIQNLYVAPNPFINQLTLGFTLLKRNNINLSISDIAGQRLYHETLRYNSGLHHINLSSIMNDSRMTKGIYFVNIQIGNHTIVKKVIKQ